MTSRSQAAALAQALNAAQERLRAGKLADADAILRRLGPAGARSAEALHLLGVVALQRGDAAAAVELFQRSTALDPRQVQAWNNLGAALQSLGRAQDARAAFERALALRPGHASTLNNLGVLHAQSGDLAEAERCYRQVLQANAEDPESHNNLGNLLLRTGRTAEALDAFRHTVALRPGSAEALGNLAVAELRSGSPREAAGTLQRALELKPRDPDLLFNLGNALGESGELEQALDAYRRALEQRADSPEIRDRLLHLQQRLCDWQGLEALAAAQLGALRSRPRALISPFSIACLPSSAGEQLLAARHWCANRLGPVERLGAGLGLAPAPQPRKRLRIGYLSGDFREHAVARLAVELFELHDRARFEVTGYSCGPNDGSELRLRLERAFDRFVDLRAASHEQAARRIRDDGIDILVDLSGYTQYSRAEILALRPAPVQVHYLGQPGTLGAGFIDYLLTDRFLSPAQVASQYAEQPVYLPSHQVNDRSRANDVIASRADCGLPEQAFVFCCFAQSFKIWPATFDAWMRILRAVPGSVLWLAQYHRRAADNLRAEAGRRGIAPERLHFARPVPYGDYLARLPLADLFLDTLPFNAHATAADALWAGLPVLTCAGETHAARLAGSILAAGGLPELIAGSTAEYESRALELARSPAALRALRERLGGRRSALFDTPRFARALETAFLRMWERACRGEKPAALDVSGD